MSDGDPTAPDYDSHIMTSRRRREEWYWMFAGASVGLGMAGAAVAWANVPAWGAFATGVVGVAVCAAIQTRVLG